MSETIGQQLKQARLAKNLSLAKVVQATRIQAHYLEALEADDFSSIPSAAQARGFLKLYAEFLGLSLEEMSERQRAASPSDLLPAPPPQAPSIPSEASRADPAPKERPRRKKAAPAEETISAAADTKAETVSPPAANESSFLVEVEKPPRSESRLSQSIFEEIGASLRKRRESLSISLSETEQHTYVRRHYLEALENGDLERLPSTVQARGMLSNYAHFLDLDVDAILLRYAEGLQIQLAERQPNIEPAEQKPAKRINLPPLLRRYLSIDILVGVGLGILLLALIFWGSNQMLRANAAITPQPTAPSILDVLVASPESTRPAMTGSPSAGGSAVPTENGPLPAITLPPAGTDPVQVVLVPSRSTWVKVTVDGKIVFEGRIAPGTAYSYSGKSQVEILTGDGAAVNIIYNQSNLGAMGTYGEVVDRIYTAGAILIPTATFTPSPTITPTFTITPRPTSTPRPSATLRPSATANP